MTCPCVCQLVLTRSLSPSTSADLLTPLALLQIASFKAKELAAFGVFKANSAEEKAFIQAADALRDDIEFAVSPAATGLSAPAATLHKTFDDRELSYDGPWEAKAIQAWLLAKSLPVVARLDQYALLLPAILYLPAQCCHMSAC